MRPIQKLAAVGLTAVLGATVYGLVRTAQNPNTLGKSGNSGSAASAVDQTPILTALKLAKIPATEEELPFVQEAIRIADKEMDLVYAAAKRELEEHSTPLSAEAKQIQARLNQSEDALAADNALVERLTAEETKASGARKDDLHNQLILITAAQQEHQDEVDDAKEDLIRAGGDASSRIDALNQEHEASSKVIDNLQITASGAIQKMGLSHRFSDWWALHQKQVLLEQAKQEADSAAASLLAAHNALEEQLKAKQGSATPSSAQTQAPKSSSDKSTVAKPTPEQSAALKLAKHGASDRKTLASLDKRIENQKDLAVVYGKWIVVVAGEQRGILHAALIGVTIILVIVLIGIFFDSWLERLLGKLSLDRRQVETLRAVTRVVLQVLAVLFVLLVIFGPPTQLGTFIGLATAGLTVALKDFIVGFIGWFVLMGRNGIRLGDWVEINGVTGEVVETGMFHTVLLETGNWTDSGHPTGRRVTFTNSFAIEGHYFNFSTSGQWLWDELQITIPPGRDPFPLVAAIRKIVLEATEESAKQAELEWQHAAGSRDKASISATPAISVRPGAGGIDVQVRYVTRANERYQLRTKLYQSAVELLGGHGVQISSSPETETKPA
jgi:small-conductance mechanosensitive channel